MSRRRVAVQFELGWGVGEGLTSKAQSTVLRDYEKLTVANRNRRGRPRWMQWR